MKITNACNKKKEDLKEECRGTTQVYQTKKIIFKSTGMGTAFNTGQMELITKVNGTLIKLRAKEHFGMRKETYIEVNLETIWPMDMVNILISMAASTKESSKMMSKRDMARKNGLMERNMLDRIKTE